MTGDLVTWETVKTMLSLDDDRQDMVEFLISAASAQAEKIACRMLAARDVELKLDSKGGHELALPSYPVNSVEALTVSGIEVEYELKEAAGIAFFSMALPPGWGNVYFKGNIGYEPVPMDLQLACIETIAANIRRLSQSGGNVGIKSMSANGAITTQYELDIPVSARNIFNSYRSARL